MTDWDIDQYNEGFNYGDEGERIGWPILDLIREAHSYEGIIVTADGQRHNIPPGGGIVRSPSASNFGPWINSCEPPEGWMSYIYRTYWAPVIADQIYSQSPLLARLERKSKPTKPAPKMPEGLTYARHVGPGPSYVQ